MSKHKPREYAVIDKNDGAWMNRILIGTPVTGLVRYEWVLGRYGQIIPTNWSFAQAAQPVYNYAPMRYMVPDAQNLIVKTCIEQDFEFCLFHEHDNVLPQDCFVRLNAYMRSCDVPIVSALYFTRSEPPEPLIYRGRGNSFYDQWKVGDKVWCDGVPTGTLLVHNSILKALWERSPEYMVNGQKTRKVFDCPENIYDDPSKITPYQVEAGTSDLTFCSRIIKEKIFDAAGWPEYQKMRYPFLVDTNIFVPHIEQDGRQFPLGGIPKQFLPDPPKAKVLHGPLKGLDQAASRKRTAANAADPGKRRSRRHKSSV